MTWDHPTAAAWLARRGPHVRARILRLNPKGPVTGELLRGWHRKRTADDLRICSGDMTKAEFIRAYGRRIWDVVSAQRPDALRWDGRRCRFSRFFVIDYRDALAALRDGRIDALPGPATRVIRKRSIRRQTVALP
jgi:hypothetical protein